MKPELNLEAFRVMLNEKEATLLNRIQFSPAENLRTNPDRSDLARLYETWERRQAITDQVNSQLERVRSALQRLEDGNYGDCIQCGKPISLERLLTAPEAEYCIRCQRQKELSWI